VPAFELQMLKLAALVKAWNFVKNGLQQQEFLQDLFVENLGISCLKLMC
jgi:hypothetical protein